MAGEDPSGGDASATAAKNQANNAAPKNQTTRRRGSASSRNAAAAPPAESVATSRPKRRSRGSLPLASANRGTAAADTVASSPVGEEEASPSPVASPGLSIASPDPALETKANKKSGGSTPRTPRTPRKASTTASSNNPNKQKRPSPSSNKKKIVSTPKNAPAVLMATTPTQSKMKLKLKVGGNLWQEQGEGLDLKDNGTPTNVEADGNSWECTTCGLPGNVVCCDGCPKVFHPDCLSSESRDTLDSDPWFCSNCRSNKKYKKSSTPSQPKKSKSKKSASPNVVTSGASADADASGNEDLKLVSSPGKACFECGEVGTELQQCELCEGWIHVPNCPGDFEESEDEDEEEYDSEEEGSPRKKIPKDPNRVLCKICRVEEYESQQEAKRHQLQEEEDGNGDKEDDDDHGGEDEDVKVNSKEDKMDEEKNEEVKTPNQGGSSEVSKKKLPSRPVRSASTRAKDKKKRSLVDTDAPIAARKRSRPALPSSKVKENMEVEQEQQKISAETNKKETQASKKQKKASKKKEKKKNNKSPPDPVKEPEVENEEDLESASLDSPGMAVNLLSGPPLGYPKAMPAFFYFLGENIPKIERHLARKHRIFQRLPKGYERNELIAKEGAVWWTKLKDSEQRRYMNMSMKEFEQRIIEWKEEKNIREMLLDDSEVKTEPENSSFDDELLTYEKHQRLYLGTTVGSKPWKPDTYTSQNRVLLDLLQDMRFHPLPMLMTNRSEQEFGQMDFDRITIPFFDVHGPFSTSVGDECLGCTRGWTHFCNVLKRRVPAVEHRAKLQPPLSSLVATRVGLGLRPKPPAGSTSPVDPRNIAEFQTWQQPEVMAANNRFCLPVATDTLTDPTSRADDIVQFIEEVTAMKVPEPARPDFPNRLHPTSSTDDDLKSNSSSTNHSNSTMKRTYDTVGGGPERHNVELMKCGRCRTVISNDTGCIQCRRAQLVINLSKRPPDENNHDSYNNSSTKKGVKAEKEDQASITSVVSGNLPAPPNMNNLKVQTLMCGRASSKEIRDMVWDTQREPDAAVANGILRQRWIPFAIMPPTTINSPTPRSRLQHRPGQEEDCQASGDDENNNSEDVSKVTEASNKDESEGDSSDAGDDTSLSSNKTESMDVDNEDDDGSSLAERRPTRTRRSRIAAAATSNPKEGEVDDELAIKFKDEAEKLQKRCVRVACRGILLGMMRRDPQLLFKSDPLLTDPRGYKTVVKNPIWFDKIREKVLEDKYPTLGSFTTDCKLLCTNALVYNPPGSIYWKCAKNLLNLLTIMQRRANKWMTALKDSHAKAWRRATQNFTKAVPLDQNKGNPTGPDKVIVDDPFVDIRKTWPEAVEMLEESQWLHRCFEADFMRTKENESAYYGALAIRRAAAAAEAALAAYPDSCGMYSTVGRRTHLEDEALRKAIDARVAEFTHPVELKDLPSWREESIIRILRRAQSRRVDGMTSSTIGCARCDGNPAEVKQATTSLKFSRLTKYKRKNNDLPRVDQARADLITGLASQATRKRIKNVLGELAGQRDLIDKAKAAKEVAVTVRGSKIHGWGLYADQYFKKNDVVAEYIGEYVSLPVTEAREKLYQEQRIQDYQFRLDDQLVIDATMRGGHGRYINHNCNPNCLAKILPGPPPNEHLKRVVIVARREIEPREELTYDYQFPLELDLDARIPCNCMSDKCRGFMNWDLPEKGSGAHMFKAQKRGANMRDRIRRLGRPLKSEKGDEDDDDDEE